MAYKNKYNYRPYTLKNGEWIEEKARSSKTQYSIFWDDGEIWIEGTLYLHRNKGKSATIRSQASDLKAYADWLEENKTDWLHFPVRAADRCLDRFRGFLLNSRDIARSTASRRMNTVVRFYKWAKAYGYIDKKIKMWEDQNIAVTFFNKTGFQRTASVWTTDLRIPNRKPNVTKLEDGLTPLTPEDRDLLLKFLKERQGIQSEILYHMFVIGFFTAARIGSIRSLRIEHLTNAIPDKTNPDIMLIAAGPGTGIDTKHDVAGYIRFLKPIHETTLRYATANVARLGRQAKATPENKSLIFLTRNGEPYSEESINTAIFELRQSLIRAGFTQFYDLKFHQSRATCGTELARLFMQESDIDAIEQVRDWLMHKDEKTTWTYIKFLKTSKASIKASKAFSDQFLGPNFEVQDAQTRTP